MPGAHRSGARRGLRSRRTSRTAGRRGERTTRTPSPRPTASARAASSSVEQQQVEAPAEAIEQPARVAGHRQRSIERWCTRDHAPAKLSRSGVERRVGDTWAAATAARCSPACARTVCVRDSVSRLAEDAADRALRRDEVGRAGGVADVLVGGRDALGIVAVEQRRRRHPASTRSSFHARLSASSRPELAPRAPNGETWCAASPAKITRPWMNLFIRRHWNLYSDPFEIERSCPSMRAMRGAHFSGSFSTWDRRG